MGEAYRGLTIRFAADGTKVMSTLKAMRRAGADVESELRLVNRALKFDGANSKTASRQLQLMAERAAAAGGEASRLRKELRILGNQEIGGKKMSELSKETKDASTQASLMRERYKAATKSLASLQNEAEQLWHTSKNLGVLPNPFTGWSDMPTEKIQEFMKMLFRTGDINMATWKRMSSAVKELRTEFNLTEGELRKLNRVAEFQSTEDKLKQLEAAAKRFRNTLRDAALQARETGQEFNLTRASASLERTSAAAERLQEAMRLDPKSFEAAIGHARMLKAEMDAVEGSSDALRAEIKQLEAMPGVKELANDARKLQEEFIASGKAVDLAAEKLGKAAAAANRLEEEAGELRNKLNAAGETAGEKLQNQVRNTEEAAKAARLEANRLQDEFDQAAEAAEKVNAALRVTDNRSQIAANNAKMQAMGQQQAKKSMMSTSAMTSLGMSMYATVYPAAMMAGSYAIQAAQEVDAAYRDMRKTVQGTEMDFENLKRKALEFGDTHVTSADQILEFEAMGGQLGVVVDDLEAFSTTVANLDIATNIDADEVAIELGKMASILDISSDEYDNFADSLVRLGNSEPALESDIMNITARFGAMAHIVGMTPDQILAIATAATATGQKAESAGGALQRLLGGIETKVSGVSEAMKELDWEGEDLEEFKELSGNLEEFANVAGMSAAEFAQAWEYDAAGAFQSFIEGLKKYADEGGSVQALLYDKLGYHNIRDLQLLQGLTNTTDVMADSLTMAEHAYKGLSDQWGAAGDAAREAEKKSQGFSGQLQILKNNGQHMADMLGESLLPAMRSLTGLASDGTKFFENMGDGAKQFTLGLVAMGVASGPALTMMAAGRNALGSLKKSLAEYASVQATTDRINGSYIARQMGLNAAYVKNGETIARNTARMREIESVQSKLNTSTMLGATASRAYTKEQVKLAAETKKAQRMNKLMTIGGGAMGALKSVGTMAGIGVGMVVLEQAITKLIDMKEKADQVRDATEGIGELTEKIKLGDLGESDDIDKTSNSLFDMIGRLNDVSAATDEVIRSNAEFSRTAQASINDAGTAGAQAEYWSNKVIELSRNFDGSGASLAELKNAVDQYNAVTGGNLKVVDEQTGRLNENTKAIKLNTEAFKESVQVKAYTDVAEGAAKAAADASVQLEVQRKALRDLWAEEKAHPAQNQVEAQMYLDKENELRGQIEATKQSYLENKKLADVAFDRAEAERTAAEESAKAADKERQRTQSVKAYSAALREAGEADDAFQQLGAALEIPTDKLDEFAASLAEDGISAKMLGQVGTEAFASMYQAADGNIAGINNLINSLNAAGIDPKTVTVTESGAMEVKGHIIDLQNMTIDGKSFTVTANGVEGADEDTNQLLKDVGILDDQTAEPNAELDDNASGKISAITTALAGLDGKSATVSVYQNTYQSTYKKTIDQGTTKEGPHQAAGGINKTLLRQIPRHADGGMTGIVTRATLTNQGLIGEDGAEAMLRMGRQTAVVPLTNTRYVRPFARAVASEIPGSSSSSTVNNYYSLNGLTVAAGSDESRALEVLAGAMRRGRRGHGR